MQKTVAKFEELYHLPTNVFVLNEHGEVLFENKRASETLGLSHEARSTLLLEILDLDLSDLQQIKAERSEKQGKANFNNHKRELSLEYTLSYARDEFILILHVLNQSKSLSQGDSQLQKYYSFFHESTEGIWCITFEEPLDTSWAIERQVDHFLYEGTISEYNQQLSDIYQVEYPKIFEGVRVIDIFTLESKIELEELKKSVAEIIEADWSMRGVVKKTRTSRGELLYVSRSGKASINDDGLIHQFWGVTRDVTSDILRNKQVQQMNTELLAIDKINKGSISGNSLSDLSESIADTLKTLFSSLLGYRFLRFSQSGERLSVVHELLGENLKKLLDDSQVKITDLTPPVYQDAVVTKLFEQTELLSGQQLLATTDTSLEELREWVKKWSDQFQADSIILLPLKSGKQLLGTILLFFEDALNEADRSRINRLARGIGNAISKAFAEDEIRRQREYIDSLLSNLPVDIAVLDENQRYQYINRHSLPDSKMQQKWIGKTERERFVKAGMPEGSILLGELSFKKAMSEGKEISWEDTIRPENKKPRYILRHLKPVYTQNVFQYMIAYGVEITRQKRLENLLFTLSSVQKKFIKSGEQANLYKDLLTSYIELSGSAGGFIAVEDTEKQQFTTRAATQKFWNNNISNLQKLFKKAKIGLTRVKWLGNQKENADLLNQVKETDEEFKLHHLPKNFSDESVFLCLGFYQKGRLKAIIGLIRKEGIFTHDQIEFLNILSTATATLIDAYFNRLKAVKNEQLLQRLADVVSFSNESIIGIDLELKISHWNKASAELFGYSSQEAIGKPLSIIIPVSRHEEIYTVMSNLYEGEEIKNYEIVLKDRLGKPLDVLLSLFTSKNESGKIIGISGIVRDNAERKRYEQSRLKSIIEGEEKERNRIAQNLHDSLGQILTGLSLNLQAADLNIDKDIENLMDISKKANNAYREISLSLISPAIKGEKLGDAIKNICSSYEKTGVNIRHQISFTSKVDPEIEILLYRCAQELIYNAVKYADSKIIEVVLREANDALQLRVEDNGGGFDQKIALKKGKGLHSMQSRVQLLGGSFVLNSRKGMGTSIRISIANS